MNESAPGAFSSSSVSAPGSADKGPDTAAAAWRGQAAAALFGIAYFAAVLLGHALSLRPSAVATFWPGAGLYVAALLLAPPRRWPALIAAAGAASITAHVWLLAEPLALSLGTVAASGLEAVAGAVTIRLVLRGSGGGIEPACRLRDTLAIGAAALAAPVAGATVSAAAVAALAGASFAEVWPVWWVADAVGIAVAAPLTLAAVRAWKERSALAAQLPKGRLLEAVAALAAVVACTAAVFWLPLSPMRPTFWTLPPLMWVALRHGQFGATAAAALLALTAAAGMAAGAGPYLQPGLNPAGQALILQMFLFVAVAMTQLMAAVVTERAAASSRLAAVNAGLGAAVAARTAELTAANARVTESEARLRLFVDRAPAAIAMFDTEMRYLAVSRRFLRDFALDGVLDPQSVIGRSHYDVVPDIPERWREINRRVIGGETLSAGEDQYPHADGRIDWVQWEMTPWRRADGSAGGALLAAEMVTTRKQGEAALAENEARLHDLVQTLDLGTFMTRAPDGTIHFWSKGAERLYGWTAAEAVGRVSHDLLRTVFPVALAEVEAALERDGEWSGDLRHRTRDGRELIVSARKALRRGPDGQPLSVMEALTDTTAQRRAEAELAELNRRLEERVREEVAAREDAQARAAHAQRIQALGQLAGGIAHDFNNILQAVSGAATLIEQWPEDRDKTRRLARTAIDAAARGASITQRLLSFGRRGEMRAEAVPVSGLLEGMRDVLAHTLGSPISVRSEVPADIPPVMADRGQLETALVNLGINARDAMPQGGTLTFSARAENVSEGGAHPAGLTPGDYVRISAADTGTGMDEATLTRVTEPFFTTKPPGQGTGLGLPMVKGFAEQSGGAFMITSAPGAGTTVTLWLPQAASLADHAQAGEEDYRGGPGGGARILLVDDDELVRETLAAQLEDVGFSTLVAASGAEALELLQSGEEADALVSDLSMYGMNGVETIRQARHLRPGLPCFLLTGYMGERAALSSGDSFALVRKPVAGRALAARIRASLEAARNPDSGRKAASGDGQAPAAHPREDVTVMVVEDDESLRESLADFLDLEGIRAVGAADGREALQLLASGVRPDAIILDLMMPGMNGWEFRRAQMSAPELRNIPVFVVSGVNVPSAEVETLKALEFVQKPFDPVRLVAAVAQAAGRRDG
ncbi:Histidine kinase (plasmid) [Rhodovastum atsumiense]|uniref:response regulator n=1 Tax=Rhodovastum atsumiense TaxID=504468 RepID=UPI002025152B|nr:response regulator [Rhodovastum atsumiense]CAH2605637.1 Histidine kinase [Rhodovastum atsumiense]